MRQSRRKAILPSPSVLTFVFLPLLMILVFSSARPIEAQQQRPRNITIVYAGTSSNQAPGWVAYETGIFRKYGLEVQLVQVTGGPKAVQVLTSGYATLAQVPGPSVVQRSLQGGDVVLIGALLNTMNYQLIVDKTIQRPEDLRGKSLAVSRAGSSSDFATRFALDKYGLAPGKDVSIVEIGTQPERFSALETGRVQGVMLEVPLTLKAKRMGMKVLADLQMLGLEYQAAGLATTRSLIKSRPDVFRSLMKAYVEAIHYYKTHPRESMGILQKYLKIDDPDALRETYEGVGLTLVPERPYPTLKGIQMILGEMAAVEPRAQTAKPDQFVDLTFLKELDESGFIDQLYKSRPALASTGARAATSKDAPAAKSAAAQDKRKQPAVPQSKASAAGTQEYTIQSGDTLAGIAQKYYGDVMKWTRIFEANKQTLKTPNFIFVGQKIIIPLDNMASGPTSGSSQ